MDSRREFLKKAALLSSAAGMASALPPSVAKAFSIDPEAGTTWKDAEHVVILMQENRSFDHCFGSMRGVRGFNDPRAMKLPNRDSVFLQRNFKDETFAPFRLNMKDTKATWMGSLPHGWTDQTDARNNGAYDRWLVAKASGNKDFKHMPLTLGYYNREDLAFYYSLADAFTVCDQNFCSSLTGTTPNRLYLWTGKTRDDDQTPARVRNGEADYHNQPAWKTFPERLEENSVSWKIYQNELSVGVGFEGEEDSWLSNFTDNPIEFFSQYNVRYHPPYLRNLPNRIDWLKNEIASDEQKVKTLWNGDAIVRLNKRISSHKDELAAAVANLEKFGSNGYNKLSHYEKSLHEKAFVTNAKDPDYHSLTSINYNDNGTERKIKVPKGDVLHQFRHDVKNGELPTVSWLVAPENFSDHPGAPWYGAWYLSEVVDILTENPEVWKKTIFILCYDENDGYFDHIPPFVPPIPNNPSSGKVSDGIDVKSEYVFLEDDLKRESVAEARGGPIGLGYRVPLVIASPWSRGGAVCSQVFDHTSILMFLEKFLKEKTGKEIIETNISAWRRTVCGDLTSTFTQYNGEKYVFPEFVKLDPFVKSIYNAKFKELPTGFRPLTKKEIEDVNSSRPGILPKQESGTRVSRALPYELQVNGKHRSDKNLFEITFEARNDVFKSIAAGAPFQVYSYGSSFSNRSYAVKAGDKLIDTWTSNDFHGTRYHLRVHGPNGFFREFQGLFDLASIDIECRYDRSLLINPTGDVLLAITNNSKTSVEIVVTDHSYNEKNIIKSIDTGENAIIKIESSKRGGWYDSSVSITGNPDFNYRFAGRVETGRDSVSDPAMA
jgi:phospholipase C